MTAFTLNDLAATISERVRTDDVGSYTAKLAARGVAYCARKMGEEAIETVVAAVEGDRNALRDEAADLLYHLLVTLQVGDVPLGDVLEELYRRTSQTGLEEKAGRKTGPGTS